MKRRSSTAFYVESLLLVALILSVSVILMRTLGNARTMSLRARELTGAQQAAQTVGEYFYAADDETEFLALLAQEPSLSAVSDGKWAAQASGEAYTVQTQYTTEPQTVGSMAALTVFVTADDGTELCRYEMNRYLPQ